MECEVYQELLSARLDGELTAAEEQALTGHLKTCLSCRELAGQLEAVHAALAAQEAEAPGELTPRVMLRVREEQARQRRSRQGRLVRWAAGLAACLAVCAGAWGMLRNPDAGIQPAQHMDEDPKQPSGSQVRTIGPASFSASPEHYEVYEEQAVLLEGAVSDAPSAVVLDSPESLEDFAARYPGQVELQGYDADFFRTRHLLAIVVQSEGDTPPQIGFQGLLREEVTVLTGTGTGKGAAWLILAQVDALFRDGDVLSVTLASLSG